MDAALLLVFVWSENELAGSVAAVPLPPLFLSCRLLWRIGVDEPVPNRPLCRCPARAEVDETVVHARIVDQPGRARPSAVRYDGMRSCEMLELVIVRASRRLVAVREVFAVQDAGSGCCCQEGQASGDGTNNISTVSELTAHLDLPVKCAAPAAARQTVTTTLTAWGFPDGEWMHDAVLVADELVANAVRHGGGCLVLQIRADRDQVSIAVVDGSVVVPRRRAPDGDGGRGLAIIEALSQGWGVQDHYGGKCVWVRLLPPPSPCG